MPKSSRASRDAEVLEVVEHDHGPLGVLDEDALGHLQRSAPSGSRPGLGRGRARRSSAKSGAISWRGRDVDRRASQSCESGRCVQPAAAGPGRPAPAPTRRSR